MKKVGHSADVLVHAIMDALLAAALGDIGKHFRIPEYKGTDPETCRRAFG